MYLRKKAAKVKFPRFLQIINSGKLTPLLFTYLNKMLRIDLESAKMLINIIALRRLSAVP